MNCCYRRWKMNDFHRSVANKFLSTVPFAQHSTIHWQVLVYLPVRKLASIGMDRRNDSNNWRLSNPVKNRKLNLCHLVFVSIFSLFIQQDSLRWFYLRQMKEWKILPINLASPNKLHLWYHPILVLPLHLSIAICHMIWNLRFYFY